MRYTRCRIKSYDQLNAKVKAKEIVDNPWLRALPEHGIESAAAKVHMDILFQQIKSTEGGLR